MDWDGARLGNRLKPRHLRLLADIARLGSLTRVAAAAGISQPAVTKALAELEDIFGAPLFERTGRGLRPTPLGELALLRAGRMRHDLELWAREIASVHEGRSAHLQVGAVPYVSATLLSTAASGLYRRHGATLTLHRATTDQLVPMLRGHELDCVISRATSTLVADDLTHHVLYRQRPCLVAHVASARRLARRKSDWAAVAGMDWVLPASGTPTRRLIAEHFIHAGLRAPAPVLEAYSTDVIEGMLAADEALVSVLPDDIAAEVCQHGKLGRVPWDFGWELPPINLIRRREARALVAEEAFASILLECCAGQKRQGPGPGA